MDILKNIYFERKDIHYYVILLSAPLLLSIYRYNAYPGTFEIKWDFGIPSDQAHIIVHFFLFFLMFFLIPVLYGVFAMKKDLRFFGLGAGDFRSGLKYLLLIPLVILPVMYFAAKMPDIRGEYPLARSLISDQSNLIVYELAYFLFYYIAWEFYFRGFLLFGLKDRFGTFNAILIQTISSCLIHIGKPEGEVLGSIAAGILFGIIAVKTRSVWYVIILHAAIGILTDIFVIYSH
jgi:membrane protease YdiL (CAAX protease family)